MKPFFLAQLAAAGSRIAALFSAAGPCVAHSGTDGAWEREIESGLEAGYVRVGRYANRGCRAVQAPHVAARAV
jgi:hypothetical protein